TSAIGWRLPGGVDGTRDPQAATARTASATAPATASPARSHHGPAVCGGGGTTGTISGTWPSTWPADETTSVATRSFVTGGYAAPGSTTTRSVRSSTSWTGTSAVRSDPATTGTVPPRIAASPTGSPAP